MSLPWRILAGLGLLAAVLAFGWVGGCIHTGHKWELRQAKQAAAADARYLKLAQSFADTDQRHTQELRRLQDENARLSAAVSSGAVRLRVAAKCPVQAAAAGAGVDHGEAPELDPSARPTYFALRAGLDRQLEQLNACLETLANERSAGGR